jgi:hypothetical protein
MELLSAVYPTLETMDTTAIRPTAEEQAAFEMAIAQKRPGPMLWNIFNALAFLILITLVLLGVGFGYNQVNNIEEVKANWKEYRCQPSIMPFAGMYGHDAVDNFQFCLRNIFDAYSQEITSPFTSVLGIFGEIVGKLFGAVNGIQTSVASMGGGIMVIFQDFTDRIMNFFFKLRLSAIRIKNLIGRMHALLFSVMFMGISGIKGAQNFSNTAIFKFLAVFCFAPDTVVQVLDRGSVAIADVRIGDVLLPTRSRVSAKLHFETPGQPMVTLRGVKVSAEHYVQHGNAWIPSREHPESVPLHGHNGSLICLDTDDHRIPIRDLIFRDYDETMAGGVAMMQAVERRLNAITGVGRLDVEYSPTVNPAMRIRMADGSLKEARHICTGDRLSTGGQVIGLLQKEVREVCPFAQGFLGAATLVWRQDRWSRIGTFLPSIKLFTPAIYIGFVVLPQNQIELHTGDRIRDYIEIACPDVEEIYQAELTGDAGHTGSWQELGTA